MSILIQKAKNGVCRWRHQPALVSSKKILLRAVWLGILVSSFLPFGVQIAQAHGGVIVAGDMTEKYEWIIQVTPYPVTTPGETFVSLVVYDIKTYQPINGLSAQAYLAPPGSTELCCQPGRDLGPIEILIDAEQYPGDYSILYDFSPVGQWSGIFIVDDGSGDNGGEPLTMPFSFLVLPQDLSQFDSPLQAPSGALTSPLSAGQSNGQSQTGVSAPAPANAENIPLTETSVEPASPLRGIAGFSTGNLLLLGGAALIPLLLLLFWFLRSTGEEINPERDTDD